jgi:hypothetical protein
MRRSVVRVPLDPNARESPRQQRVRVSSGNEPSRADVVLDEVDRRPFAAQLRGCCPKAARDARLVGIRRSREEQEEDQLDHGGGGEKPVRV